MENLEKIGNLDIPDYLKNFNFKKKVEEKMENMKKLNVVIIGKTGVGKSTLINAIFGQEVAKVGTGKPITQHCESYTIGNSPITIYDSKGIETGEQNLKDLNEIYDLISRQNASNNPDLYIHICWYCVSAEGLRIEPNEISIIKKILDKIPVILVVTQFTGSTDQKEFIAKIRNEFSDNSIDLFPVMALPKISQSEFGDMNIQAHGVEKLIERSYELLPDSVKETFAAYQKVNLQIKIDNARKASIAYAGAVAAAAYQPFPIADAPIMIAIQTGMMVHITASFGINLSSFNFKTVLSGLSGPFAAAVVGRTLVSLIKLIPGIGTVIGGTINAATGGVLTFALANIYIGVLASVSRNNGIIDGQTIIDELKNAAQNINMDEMKKAWNKNKDSYSKSEAEDILNDAKKGLD